MLRKIIMLRVKSRLPPSKQMALLFCLLLHPSIWYNELENFPANFKTISPCSANIQSERQRRWSALKTKEEKDIRQYRQKRDRSSAEALVEAHYREIYAFAYRQTGNMDTAMDLTQDIFLAMLQSIHTYDPEKAAFRTWLYRIASNKIVDFFRSGQYRMAQNSIDLDSLVLPAEGTPEEAYMDRQQREQCLQALSELPFQMQQILRLKCFSQQTFREIAQALSLPEGTVKTQYYKAIAILRTKEI